ncbi:MAG TPA: nuclear transport factor 2 family protein [Gammaproteobacteria bacterium]|nr:nuclear transport factor 2 family protein [Gammaproteobacteria bacterium]
MKPRYTRITLSLSAVAAGLVAFAALAHPPAVAVTSGANGAWTDEPAVTKNLANFDTLDFDVFTNQKWDRLKESHAADIVVTWPDGHETHGLAQHIKDLQYMFSFAPDTRIKVHPIRLGVGEWTSVVGEMEGTFTQPMVLPDGKVIAPTNKPYKITMVTVGHWTKAGVMDHEWLLWDNDAFNRQIGLGK